MRPMDHVVFFLRQINLIYLNFNEDIFFCSIFTLINNQINLMKKLFILITLFISTGSIVNAQIYNYLCSELTTLVGAGNYCNTNVGNNNIKDQNLEVFPNPFEKTIYLNNNKLNELAILYNAYGEVMYWGNNISSQDFSELPVGIYFLKLSQKNQACIKLIKH